MTINETKYEEVMNIGTKVKHNEQDIVGTIIRYDCGDKVVIKLDGEDTTLSYHPRELTKE
jgi:hypothetical protein|tara:strand:+ start:1890 stop:2069 length:180 start_codon:yes stop_codon:yes gene_type:complete